VAADVEFLARSPDGIRILRELLDHSESSRGDLHAAADATRTTVQRNLDALVERGWITNSGRTYEISPCGRLVAAGVLDLVETTGMASELQEFLKWTSLEALDVDPRLLSDAEITVVDPGDPYAPVNRHVQALADADRVRLLLPVVGHKAMHTSHKATMAGDQSGEVVLSPEAAETVTSKPEYRELFADFLEHPRWEAFVTDDEVPFCLGIVDGLVQIGVEDDEGVPRALAESSSDELRAWARETFDGYVEEAREVSGSSMERVE